LSRVSRFWSEAAIAVPKWLALLTASLATGGCIPKEQYAAMIETAQLGTQTVIAEAASRVTPEHLSECDKPDWRNWGLGNWKRTEPWTLSPRHTCVISELQRGPDDARFLAFTAPYVPASDPDAKPKYRVCAFKITAKTVERYQVVAMTKAHRLDPCHRI
jgi:hypothetical protein